MDSQKPSKSISTSTPSFSIRYNAEEEEVEQLYDAPKLAEAHSDNGSPQSTPIVEKKVKDKSARRSGSFEEGTNDKEPWRLFTEIRGRFKKVEEKFEEIKTERLNKDKMKKERKEKRLKSTNSLSDSEDRSEDTSAAHASTISNASSSPEKTKSLNVATNDESDLGDISGSDEASTPEPPSTPTFTDDLVPQRPRPISSQSEIDKKDRSKSKGIKFKFTKKKLVQTTAPVATVEVAVEAFEQGDPADRMNVRRLNSDVLPIPRRKYNIMVHKYPWTAVAVAASLILAYFFQKPTFLAGIIVGVILAFLVVLWSDHLYKWISVVDPESNFLHGRYAFQNVPFLSDKVLQCDSVLPEERQFKGWMNEYCGDYNPQTYHISQTETVFIKLAGSSLRLCTPKHKIPKRAFWSEPQHKMKFIRERAYDIARCGVTLLPQGLIHKRLWSRKYPIAVELLPNSHMGTRWAETKKHLLADSEVFLDQKKSMQSNEKLDSPVRTPRDSPISNEPADLESPKSSPTRGEAKSSQQSDTKGKTSQQSSPSRSQNTDEMSMNEQFVDVSSDPTEGEEADDEDIQDFVKVSPIVEKNCIVLFARTAREKDLWYRRLVAATTYSNKTESGDDPLTHQQEKQKERREDELNKYLTFMKTYGQFKCAYEDDFGVVSFDNTSKERENYLWFNLFLARVLYDTIKQDFWIEIIKSKIQKKLSVIRVPSFMEPIKLSKIEFSDTVPAIEWTHNVNLNSDGIWTEVEVSYQGTTTMTVDTKINLIKLKALSAKTQIPNENPTERLSKTAYMNSSQEDSGETSAEEYAEKTTPANKALFMIDKLAATNFFQQVTEHRIVKKAMQGVSNTVISLNVQVKSLIGTLVLNIPPPPSDRLWYGFKPNVQIHLHAKPIFGERNINMHYVTSMIEKTLRSEFQKILVMPNMDDLVIPLMNKEMPY